MNDAQLQLEQADRIAERAHRDAVRYPRVLAVLAVVFGAFVLAMGVVPPGFTWFLAVLLPFAAAIGAVTAWLVRVNVSVTACVSSIRWPLGLSALFLGFGLGFLQGIGEREPEDAWVAPVAAIAAAAPLLIGSWLYQRKLRRGLGR